MNEFCTAEETAIRWGITARRVQIMCSEGRIKGAKKFGHAWAIPADAEKPKDARITTGEYINWRNDKKNSSGGDERWY